MIWTSTFDNHVRSALMEITHHNNRFFTKKTIKFVNIETGLRDSSDVQVLNGLKPGDTIITTGLMSLKPNGKVVLNKVKN